MSYNLLSGSVNFEGATQGTIENIVDTHSDQTVSGQKTINDLSGSTAHFTNMLQVGGTNATDHIVNVAGPVSASGNISGSAFYANGVLLTGGGGVVTALNNRAESRLVTIGSTTTELDGEANLTFNGTVLDFKATSISGSGNISGSAFYGNWAGATILGSQVQLASSKGIQDDSGLALDVAGLAVATPAGGNTVIIDQGSGAKKCTVTNLMANAPISDASALGNAGRVLLDGGVGTITSDTNLSFAASTLTVNSSLNVDSNTLFVSASNNRVGIGTITPTAPLEIFNTDAQLQLSYNSGDYATISVDDNGHLTFAPSGGKTIVKNDLIIQDDVSSDTVVQIYDSSDDGVLSGYANNSITTTIHANGSTFFNGGNVGIGTSTPNTLLEVSASTGPQLKLTNTTAKAAEFTVAANGDLTITPSGSAIFDSNLTINGNTTLGDASGDVTTINGTAVTIPNGLNFDSNTLVIDHTNNRVGIGAAAPTKALEVVGDVQISGVTPFITIGDGDAEDCGILLNSTGSGVSGIDYYVAIDYSYNTNNGAFMIGAGDAVGSNSSIQIHNGRLGFNQTGVTPSSFSIDAGKHLVVGLMSGPLPAHDQDETVIAQAVDAAGQALKIPRMAVITKVVLVITNASNLSTHNAAVFLASDSSAGVDTALSNKVELIGAGAAGTRSSAQQASATDIDLKLAQRVWINQDLSWTDTGDRYVYLVNTGTGNGTTTSAGASVVVYVEYYGAD